MMTQQEWQRTCIANQIDSIGALAVLSLVGCLLPRDCPPAPQLPWLPSDLDPRTYTRYVEAMER